VADDKLQQKLIDYIEDAHALEQNVSRILDSMISTTDDPEISEMLSIIRRRPSAKNRGCVSAWTPWEQAPPRARRRRPSPQP
jgi:hypothetical protein